MANEGLGSEFREATEEDAAHRRRLMDLTNDDIARIRAVQGSVVPHVEEHAAAFFDHLAPQQEAAPLFRRHDILEVARRLKHDHLIAMVSGVYDKAYVEQRMRLGALYSGVGLETHIFLGAFQTMIRSIGARIAGQFQNDARAALEHHASLMKLGFLDIGVIVDVLIADRERTISRQQEALLELSTPALLLRDQLLMLPIIGVLDSVRAKQLTDSLLRAIRTHRSKVVVMDVTGVAAVDSKVANHLIQTVAAARLMGATVIITGLSAEVAQSLVTLGVDLSKITTVGDLQGGIEEAERLLNLRKA